MFILGRPAEVYLQQTKPPSSSPQRPAQPTAPLPPATTPDDSPPSGNPCGCGDAGQKAIDDLDSEENHLQDAADALARGDLAEFEADLNLAAIKGAEYDRDVATAQGVHSGQ